LAPNFFESIHLSFPQLSYFAAKSKEPAFFFTKSSISQ
jgi:hypothetical protein